MPLNVIIVIPQGEPGTIEIRPKPPQEGLIGPVLPADHVFFAIDTDNFMGTDPRDLALRYAEPAFAALQGALRERGFGSAAK